MSLDALSGLLLTSRRPGERVDVDRMVRLPGLARRSEFLRAHWEQAIYTSSLPLTEEDRARGQPPYPHPLVWRISGPRLLLLSDSVEVVEHLRTLMSKLFGFRLIPVRIAVDEFVKAVASKPADYVFSFIHARGSAFGTALRAISFYGEDVTEAKYFRDGVNLFNFHSCGVRRVAGGSEFVRLGNEGSVSSRGVDSARLHEIETLLGYLRTSGYLADSQIVEGTF
jgi:hypothetical protein